MTPDPIIEDLRSIRRQLSEEAGNDLHMICQRLREWEEAHPERMVAAADSPDRPGPRRRRPVAK